MKLDLLFLRALVAWGCMGAAAAQSVTALVSEGDDIPGIGAVTSVERALINDNGSWWAVVGTSNTQVPQVLLSDGVVWAKVGDIAPTMPGTSGRIASFGPIGVNEFNLLFWIADLTGTVQAPLESQARFNQKTQGFPTGSPALVGGSSLGLHTYWTSYLDFQYEPVNFDIGSQPGGLLAGTVVDPAVPGIERTLLADVRESMFGYCCNSNQVALTGEPSPIPGRSIEGIRTHVGASAISKLGWVALWSCDLDGSTLDDGCVFRSKDATHTLIAREGAPSPVAGRVWGSLEDASLDASILEHWTLRAKLDASDPSSDGILLSQGQVLAREGEVVPASAPHPISDLGTASAPVSQDGNVFWYAAWEAPGGPVEAILLEDVTVLRTGQTAVGTALLADLDGGPLGFGIARRGRFLYAKGTLDDGRATLLRVDLGGMTDYCTAKVNSKGCPPELFWAGTPSAHSSEIDFEIQASKLLPQVMGSFFYGTDGAQSLPFKGGTLCVLPPLVRMPAKSTSGVTSWCAGTLTFDFNAWSSSGADPALQAGTSVYVQVWYRDTGFAPPNDIGLSAALEFALLP